MISEADLYFKSFVEKNETEVFKIVMEAFKQDREESTEEVKDIILMPSKF